MDDVSFEKLVTLDPRESIERFQTHMVEKGDAVPFLTIDVERTSYSGSYELHPGVQNIQADTGYKLRQYSEGAAMRILLQKSAKIINLHEVRKKDDNYLVGIHVVYRPYWEVSKKVGGRKSIYTTSCEFFFTDQHLRMLLGMFLFWLKENSFLKASPTGKTHVYHTVPVIKDLEKSLKDFPDNASLFLLQLGMGGSVTFRQEFNSIGLSMLRMMTEDFEWVTPDRDSIVDVYNTSTISILTDMKVIVDSIKKVDKKIGDQSLLVPQPKIYNRDNKVVVVED
jgi:hypothetical protein